MSFVPPEIYARRRAGSRRKRVDRCCSNFRVVLKDYCENSSLHGFRFIADSECHWTERLFWLVCVVLAWYGSWLLMDASWDQFQNSAISFAAETNYIDWDTDFPAVIVCENDNDDRIEFMRIQVEQDDRNYDLDDVFKEITYFRGKANFIEDICFDRNGNFDPNSGCPTSNLTEIARTYRTPCEEVFGECQWNGATFNCCEQFVSLATEIGICYAFNSAQTKKINSFPIVSNKKTGRSTIRAEVKVDSVVFVIARQEVPTITTGERDRFNTKKGFHLSRWYTIKEVENDAEVAETTVAQRGCRLPNERVDSFAKYSYTACLTHCRQEAMIQRCGCASHQTPNIRPKDTCDLKGILCLSGNYSALTVLQHKFSDPNDDTLKCSCPLSCEDQELKDTYGTLEESEDEDIAIFEVAMESLPTVRFKRNVVRGKLDLVVSLGGTAGLLVGASLLSFLEVIYYFTLRLCGGESGSAGGGGGEGAAETEAKIRTPPPPPQQAWTRKPLEPLYVMPTTYLS